MRGGEAYVRAERSREEGRGGAGLKLAAATALGGEKLFDWARENGQVPSYVRKGRGRRTGDEVLRVRRGVLAKDSELDRRLREERLALRSNRRMKDLCSTNQNISTDPKQATSE